MLSALCRRTAYAGRPSSARLYSIFSKPQQPRVRIGAVPPDFEAETTQGHINFHKFLEGKWTVLFSHPADFTPICTTELGAFARLAPEFEKLNTQLIGVSANGLDTHRKWIKDIEEYTSSSSKVNYPIIDDSNRRIAFLYDMLDEEGVSNLESLPLTVRTLFVIDPSKTVRLSISYPATTGRSIPEVLRVIQALQLTDKCNVETPVDWQPGEEAILSPDVSTEDAQKQFGQVREVNPYLRYVKAN